MTKQTRRRFSPEHREQSVARLSEPGAAHSGVAAEQGTICQNARETPAITP